MQVSTVGSVIYRHVINLGGVKRQRWGRERVLGPPDRWIDSTSSYTAGHTPSLTVCVVCVRGKMVTVATAGERRAADTTS